MSRFLPPFSANKPKKLSAVVNSDGWLELFCNQARADELAKAKMGERIEGRRPK